jgi:hypothetical protein
MQFKIKHKTSKFEAMQRIKKMLVDQRAQIEANATDVKTEWKDNVLAFEFTAQGTHISGTLTVTDHEFDVYAKLPLMYRLFEGTIEKMVAAEAAKLGI